MADFFPEYEYQPVPSGLLLTQSWGEQKLLLKQWRLCFLWNGCERWSLRDDIWCSRYLYAKLTCMLRSAIAAAEAGNMILCEKTHSLRTVGRSENYARCGRKSLELKKYGWYNYRRVPAVTLAQEYCWLQGNCGKDFQYRGNFLQGLDDPVQICHKEEMDCGGWIVEAARVRGDRWFISALHLIRRCGLMVGIKMSRLWPRLLSKSGFTRLLVPSYKKLWSMMLVIFPLSILKTVHLALFLNYRLRARAQGTLYIEDQRREMASIRWVLTLILNFVWNILITSDEGIVRGWALDFTSTDGDHPYMNAAWIPGHFHRYEHHLFHQK